jgi:tyrosyl-tRNA synthetase
VNNLKVTDITRALTVSDLLFGKHVLLRKGKRTYAVITLI